MDYHVHLTMLNIHKNFIQISFPTPKSKPSILFFLGCLAEKFMQSPPPPSTQSKHIGIPISPPNTHIYTREQQFRKTHNAHTNLPIDVIIRISIINIMMKG